jgi:hypothetical protein
MITGVKIVVAESYRHILRQRSPVTPDFSILAAALPAPIDSDKAVFPPWGIDRLNQPSLPLDSSYKSEYTGEKVILTASLSVSNSLPLSLHFLCRDTCFLLFYLFIFFDITHSFYQSFIHIN